MDAIIRIIEVLSNIGTPEIKVHLPNMAKGTCKAPYVVVTDLGQSGDNSTFVGNKTVEILVYVPRADYSAMGTTKDVIKLALKDEAWLKRTGGEQSTIYLDSIEGWMSSIEYKISKRL